VGGIGGTEAATTSAQGFAGIHAGVKQNEAVSKIRFVLFNGSTTEFRGSRSDHPVVRMVCGGGNSDQKVIGIYGRTATTLWLGRVIGALGVICGKQREWKLSQSIQSGK